jgi:hypothetical protein
MADDAVDFKLYRYDPSLAAAVIFIILFLVITAVHSYQLVRTRAWIFIPFVVGGFCKSVSTMIRYTRLTQVKFKSLDTSA